MRASYFLWLLINFFILSGCTSQSISFTPENVSSVLVEGCGLDGFYNEKTSYCERELVIDEKQQIKVFVNAIEEATAYDGPLNAVGNNYEFTLVQENGDTTELKVFLGNDERSFQKSNGEDVRYFFTEGDDQKMFDIIESEIKKTP